MRRRALLVRTSTALLTVAVAGCSSDAETPDGGPADSPDGSPTGSAPSTTDPSPSPSPTPAAVRTGSLPVEFRDHELVRRNVDTADELAAVAGTLENVGADELGELRVLARFVADGGVVGEGSVETDGLPPGATWEFEVAFDGSGADARAVTDYRLVVRRRD